MRRQSKFLVLLPMLFAFLVAACGVNEPKEVVVPDEIDRVASAFLKEVQAGKMEAAERHVAPTARDELQQTFAKDHKILKNSGKMTPRFYMPKPKGSMAPQDSEARLVYAVNNDGKWTSAEIRVFRIDDEPYEVDYWNINNNVPQPFGIGTEFSKIRNGIVGVMAALALLCAIGLGILIWLVRRRPALVSPEIEPEKRVAAVTTRVEDGE